MFDNEPVPNTIVYSSFVAFDSRGFTPAKISSTGLTITPTIFKIAEYSIWVFSLTGLPIPLETECYVEIFIPADLRFDNTIISGSEMFAPVSGNVVDGVDEIANDDGSVTVRFEACYKERSVGPSPQGRLEINRISTPVSRRDTGAF